MANIKQSLPILCSGVLKGSVLLLNLYVFSRHSDSRVLAAINLVLLLISYSSTFVSSSLHEYILSRPKSSLLNTRELFSLGLFKPFLFFPLSVFACLCILVVCSSVVTINWWISIFLLMTVSISNSLLSLQYLQLNRLGRIYPLFYFINPSSLSALQQLFLVAPFFLGLHNFTLILSFQALLVSLLLVSSSALHDRLASAKRLNSKASTYRASSSFYNVRFASLGSYLVISAWGFCVITLLSKTNAIFVSTFSIVNQIMAATCFYSVNYFEHNKHLLSLHSNTNTAIVKSIRKSQQILLYSGPAGMVLSLIVCFRAFYNDPLALKGIFWPPTYLFFILLISLSIFLSSFFGPNGKILAINQCHGYLFKVCSLINISLATLIVSFYCYAKHALSTPLFASGVLPLFLAFSILFHAVLTNAVLNRKVKSEFNISLVGGL